MHVHSWQIAVSLLILAWSTATVVDDDLRVGLDFFENRIRPDLVDRCFKCHAGEKREGKLRLDRRESFLKGGAVRADDSPDAFDGVVQRLLDSPQYGVHWSRHWLDVARYGDTRWVGAGEDRRWPFAFTYRDWVIKSLNEDMPYDRSVTLQLTACATIPSEVKMLMPLWDSKDATLDRRQMLRHSGAGIGALALASSRQNTNSNATVKAARQLANYFRKLPNGSTTSVLPDRCIPTISRTTVASCL